MAAIMLFMGNGIVFAGVQFGITVMRMGEDDERRRAAACRSRCWFLYAPACRA
jgi:hypothetical protein